MSEDTYVLVHCARFGSSAYARTRETAYGSVVSSTLQGYCRTAAEWLSDHPADRYRVEDGAPFVETAHLHDTPGFVRAVMRAPLFNAELGPREVRKWGDTVTGASPDFIAALSAGGFGAALACGPLGGLDYVGADIYCAYWRGHGARVGAYVAADHSVRWETL